VLEDHFDLSLNVDLDEEHLVDIVLESPEKEETFALMLQDYKEVKTYILDIINKPLILTFSIFQSPPPSLSTWMNTPFLY
jgi:hypothetical protein